MLIHFSNKGIHMARINRARFAVLGMLTMGAASGYDIKKAMSQSTDHFWREGDGSIYPILKQLLTEKLVSCELSNIESGKPKKIYCITSEGQHVLETWLVEDTLLFQNRDELLLKIFFGWNVDPQITIHRLEKYQEYIRNRLEEYKTIAKKFTEKKITRDKLHRFLTLKAGLHYLECRLKWSEESLDMLKHEIK